MSKSVRNGWEHHQDFNDWTLNKDSEAIAHVYQKSNDPSDGYVITMRDFGDDWFGQKTQTFDSYFAARHRGNQHLHDYTQQEYQALKEMGNHFELRDRLSTAWMHSASGPGQDRQPEMELER